MPVIDSIREHADNEEQFVHAVNYVIYSSILRDHQRKQKLRLSRNAIEGYQKEFCDLDCELQSLNIQRILATQDEVSIPLGVGYGPRSEWSELSLVELEAGKQRRHLPLRKCFSRAGDTVRALMPCLMMSPQTVSEFLEPKRDLFDIVIIDEASQMRPEEALPALARSKQLIVTGDDKQLPPTSFFMAAESVDEDSDEEEEKAESILGMASMSFGNVRQLRWHYRSRHDSLIQYCNKEFYDDHLIVFPSPITDGKRLGVTYHYANGSYFEGLNEKEADNVVLLVSKIMRYMPNKSIGIAAINMKQREHILQQM